MCEDEEAITATLQQGMPILPVGPREMLYDTTRS